MAEVDLNGVIPTSSFPVTYRLSLQYTIYDGRENMNELENGYINQTLTVNSRSTTWSYMPINLDKIVNLSAGRVIKIYTKRGAVYAEAPITMHNAKTANYNSVYLTSNWVSYNIEYYTSKVVFTGEEIKDKTDIIFLAVDYINDAICIRIAQDSTATSRTTRLQLSYPRSETLSPYYDNPYWARKPESEYYGYTNGNADPFLNLTGYMFWGGFSAISDAKLITIKSVSNGSASSSTTHAGEGDTVTITLTPNSGYVVDKMNTTISSSVAVAPQWDSDTQFHFTMPADNVTITPAFKEPQTIFTNTLNPTTNGTATVSAVTASIGSTVTVNCSPNTGFLCDRTNTTLTSAVVVTPVWDDDTTFHYTMPAADVTIQVTFKEKPYWSFSIAPSTNGSASASVTNKAYVGDRVNVTFSPLPNYQVNRTSTTVMAGLTRVDLYYTSLTTAYFTVPELNADMGSIVLTPVFMSSDPYQPGGTSGAGGGGGTYPTGSDPVPPSPLPNISVTNSGLVTLFRPNASQVASLGAYLWTNLTDFIENLQKMFSNPMDTFIAFNIVPCIPEVGVDRKIKLGIWETTISMPPVLSQWYEFNFGSIYVTPITGTFLDFYPNTKISLMLPFIGSVQLNTDEIMGRNLSLSYRIDLLSGQCVAIITVDGNVYYQFTGECSTAIPLTGSDWSRVYSAAVGAVGTAITGGIAAAGSSKAAAAFTGATLAGSASRATNAVAQAGNAFSHVPKGVHGAPAMRQALVSSSNQAIDAISEMKSSPVSVGNGIKAAGVARTVNNFVGDVMSSKASISHSGTISGAAGMLGVRQAYLLIEYPNQSLPVNLKRFVGYPLNATKTLEGLSGYTVCEQVFITGFPGTDTEYAELVEALKTGVYL